MKLIKETTRTNKVLATSTRCVSKNHLTNTMRVSFDQADTGWYSLEFADNSEIDDLIDSLARLKNL